jgi:hypothetical protein
VVVVVVVIFIVVVVLDFVVVVNWFSAAQLLPNANKFSAQIISPVAFKNILKKKIFY